MKTLRNLVFTDLSVALVLQKNSHLELKKVGEDEFGKQLQSISCCQVRDQTPLLKQNAMTLMLSFYNDRVKRDEL